MTHHHDIGHRLLVPLDGSALATLALMRAVALATPEADIILFRAVPPSAAKAADGSRDSTTTSALSAAQLYLEEVAGQVAKSAPDVGVEIVVAAGDPVAEIAKAVQRLDVDAIVMASVGQGGISRWTFGSVAGKVIHRVDVPVLIVRPGDETGNSNGSFRRIIVPLDGSTRAEQSLPIAQSFALRHAIPVLLVTVLDPVQAGLPDNSRTSLASEAWHDVRPYAQMRAQQSLARAGAFLRDAGVTVSTELVEGPVVDCLRALSRPDDLIMLTSRTNEYGLPWEEGSIAKRIIRAIAVPILLNRRRVPTEIVVPLSEELEPLSRGR